MVQLGQSLGIPVVGMSKSRQVAVLGGTFNPVHCGHLVMADQALHQFGLDEVLWIPAGDPPHKPVAPGCGSQDRLEMVRLAIADQPRFRCSDMELQRQGPSYTALTLDSLTTQDPDTEWFWILGVDAFRDLPRWHEAERVAQMCRWIIAPRVGPQSSETVAQAVRDQLQVRYDFLQAPYIEISSTFLRQQIHQGGSIRYLVPPAVEDYIQTHHLYHFDPKTTAIL